MSHDHTVHEPWNPWVPRTWATLVGLLALVCAALAGLEAFGLVSKADATPTLSDVVAAHVPEVIAVGVPAAFTVFFVWLTWHWATMSRGHR